MKTYNALEHGLKGNGEDDRAAFEALKEKVVAEGGGIICFPAGVWPIDKLGDLDPSIQIAGAGLTARIVA